MKKQILLIKIVCLLLLTLPLSGCWDKREIEKRAYVIAMGLDKGKDGNLKVTYLIINPEYGSQQGGSSTNEPANEIITFETGSLITAESKANIVIAKEVSYDLLRNIIVSEELAKTKDFLRWMYDLTKEKDIRRDSFFIVTKEAASEFILNNKPKLETRAHKYYDIIIRRNIEIGIIPYSDLHRYYRITEADADLFLGIYTTAVHEEMNNSAEKSDDIIAGQMETTGQTNTTQFIGSALFKEGKMIGKLTGEETRFTYLLNNTENAPDMVLSIPDPINEKYQIALRIIKLKKNDIKIDTNTRPAKINVTVPMTVDVLSDHSMVNYAINKDKRNLLKQHLEKRFTKKMMEFIKKTQDEYKGEPFGWSLAARKSFATIPEYENFDWMKSYPDMDVNINVKIQFGEFGRQSRLPKYKDVRD
jgi:spore germination protein KC